MKFPKQLRNPEFKFFLVKENSKFPIEKRYNKDNNYPFFHSKLDRHRGNVGILAGYGGLIVLDFDDESFYLDLCKELPITFTVRSGKKKQPHLYYYLKDEMFHYFGIDRYYDLSNKSVVKDMNRLNSIEKQKETLTPLKFNEWLESLNLAFMRVCDVMSEGGKVLCPGSKVDNKYYDVVVDKPIAEITRKQLEAALGMCLLDIKKKRKEFNKDISNSPEEVKKAIEALKRLGLNQAKERHFSCLFHTSEGGSCLLVNDDGSLKCFHCGKYWSNVHNYIDEAIEAGVLR